jgi:hypothetical protein
MPRPKQYSSAAEKQRAYRERQEKARIAEMEAKGIPGSASVPTMPSTARWNKLIEQGKVILETCREEMQMYFEERTEQWQEGERGIAMQEKIEMLEEIIQNLENTPL